MAAGVDTAGPSSEPQPANAGRVPLELRPGVLVVGAANVGKRTLLSRLISTDISDADDLSSGVLCQGWTIDTKYYSADISIWTAHLDEGFSYQSLPNPDQLTALLLVFDMSNESSFLAVKNWASGIDIKRFEILLCVGNKVDLVRGHQAHAEYRRRMRNVWESDPHPEYSEFGINEFEAFSLLREEEPEPAVETRSASMEWCINNNIEYVEACASNVDFDKCLSVDGDSQGLERLFGALSAHMWPGMILKSGIVTVAPPFTTKAESSENESDYEVEYEILSEGSDQQWEEYVSASSETNVTEDSIAEGRQSHGNSNLGPAALSSRQDDQSINAAANNEDTQGVNSQGDKSPKDKFENVGDTEDATELPYEHYGLDDIEKLMFEIGNMRSNLRLMPDFQRREMAANLALKMASMFGDDSDDEEP